jgi:hypothetical protein
LLCEDIEEAEDVNCKRQARKERKKSPSAWQCQVPYQHPDMGNHHGIQVHCSVTSTIQSRPCTIRLSPAWPHEGWALWETLCRGWHCGHQAVAVVGRQWLSPCSVLTLETVCFSESMVSAYKSTWHYNPQHWHLHQCQNLNYHSPISGS